MTINIDQAIKAMDGSPLMYSDKDQLTFRVAVVFALTAENNKEELTGLDKIRRFNLANKIYSSGDAELSLPVEDWTYINNVCAKNLQTIPCGRVNQIINGEQ